MLTLKNRLTSLKIPRHNKLLLQLLKSNTFYPDLPSLWPALDCSITSTTRPQVHNARHFTSYRFDIHAQAHLLRSDRGTITQQPHSHKHSHLSTRSTKASTPKYQPSQLSITHLRHYTTLSCTYKPKITYIHTQPNMVMPMPTPLCSAIHTHSFLHMRKGRHALALRDGAALLP